MDIKLYFVTKNGPNILTFNSKMMERPKIFLWPFSPFFGLAYSPLNSPPC